MDSEMGHGWQHEQDEAEGSIAVTLYFLQWIQPQFPLLNLKFYLPKTFKMHLIPISRLVLIWILNGAMDGAMDGDMNEMKQRDLGM